MVNGEWSIYSDFPYSPFTTHHSRNCLYCSPKFLGMSEKKPASSTSRTPHTTSLFDKQNLMLMLLGVGVIALGMLLMVGGSSKDPSVFNYYEVYSARRITVAPILIILGLGIEIYAIFKQSKTN